MKKRIIGILCAIIATSMLASCGTLTDTTNYNFPKEGIVETDEKGMEKEAVVFTNKNKNAEVYYDVSISMQGGAGDRVTQGIVQDSVDAITKTWNDVSTELYSVNESGIEKKDNISYINDLSKITYSGESSDSVVKAIDNENKSGEKVIVPRIKLIVTDLNGQLQNYQDLAEESSKKIIDKKQSFAIMSVKTANPFFIIAIGNLTDLSSYIDEFYNMPNVSSYNGTMDWTGMDREYNVNCKICPQNSGIVGIDYDNIKSVEQGTYAVDKNGKAVENNSASGQIPVGNPGEQPPAGGPGGPPPAGGSNGGGAAGQAPQDLPRGLALQTDEKGSFSILRPDYQSSQLDKVEGTVNFTPDKDNTVELDTPVNISTDDVKPEDIRYLAYKSMLWTKSPIVDLTDDIAGKIKFNVPFESVSQIQLSNLDFGVETNLSDAKNSDKEFFDSDNITKDNIEVTFASNGGPQSTEWRIDNVDKTAMINVYVKDLTLLSYVTKLDITFSASDPGSIPVWVQEWSKNPKFKNLQNFISLLNEYNTKGNKFEEKLTVYLLAGDKDTYDSVKIETLEKENANKFSEVLNENAEN